jgi:RNA polymerase sigma-70 factor (ECF subfamily)
VYDWQAIVAEHGPAVWRTARRLLGNNSDAADCFQDAFLAAFEVAQRQHVRNVAGLLVRLATTRAIDRLRQERRRDRRQAHADERPIRLSAAADPAGQAQTRDLAEQLRRAISKLPPHEAKAFALRYLEDMSYREIAEELGIRTNAAGVLLHRAKDRLRAMLTSADVTDEVYR